MNLRFTAGLHNGPVLEEIAAHGLYTLYLEVVTVSQLLGLESE